MNAGLYKSSISINMFLHQVAKGHGPLRNRDEQLSIRITQVTFWQPITSRNVWYISYILWGGT